MKANTRYFCSRNVTCTSDSRAFFYKIILIVITLKINIRIIFLYFFKLIKSSYYTKIIITILEIYIFYMYNVIYGDL